MFRISIKIDIFLKKINLKFLTDKNHMLEKSKYAPQLRVLKRQAIRRCISYIVLTTS